jgi:hypothetical protein
MWETLLWLLVGAVIGFLPTWFFSNRSHKWELEEKKSDRAIAAHEIRLKEGEEKIKDYTREFFSLMGVIQSVINAKSYNELQAVEKIVAVFNKKGEEIDEGRATYGVSVKSLGDEQLTKALEKVKISFETYKAFFFYLAEFLQTKGFTPLQKEHDKNVEKELAMRQSYLFSVEEFLRRINELRSQ